MYLALFLVAIIYLYVVREEKNLLFKYGILSGILVLFPLTNVLLKRYFQGFYSAGEIQWLIPVLGLVAYAVVEIYGRREKALGRKLLLLTICLVVVLSGCLSHAYLPGKEKVDQGEVEEVLGLVLENGAGRQVSLVAPKEIMVKVRAYDGRILTAYGRDIWETDLDYAFYGNYEEWAYGLIEHMEEPFEDNEELLMAELSQSGATHVIFDKENLTFGEDMHYPQVINYDGMSLSRKGETRHFVIYECTK